MREDAARRRGGPGSAVAFYAVCAVCSPVMAIGYAAWVARLYGRRGSKASATAQGPLSARWMQHRLGTRPDEAAHRLLTALPGASPLAVRLVFGPMLLASRATGFVPPTFRYPFEGELTIRNQAAARQTFYDDALDRYLPGVAQLLVLGAGFDTRALRLPPGHVPSFEVDRPETIAAKRAALEDADVDATGVTFVGADFEDAGWFDSLQHAGFDPHRPSLVLWEGVTPYLEPAAVESTLRHLGATAPGTVVAFDHLSERTITSRSPALRLLRASLQAGGEPLKWGVPGPPPLGDRVAELLERCGLTLVAQRTIGAEGGRRRALGGMAIATVGDPRLPEGR